MKITYETLSVNYIRYLRFYSRPCGGVFDTTVCENICQSHPPIKLTATIYFINMLNIVGGVEHQLQI